MLADEVWDLKQKPWRMPRLGKAMLARNAGNSRSTHLDVGGKDLYRNGTNQERMD